jgi:hypothetical protein
MRVAAISPTHGIHTSYAFACNGIVCALWKATRNTARVIAKVTSMIRFTAAAVVATLMFTAIPASAQEMLAEQAKPVVTVPSTAVLDAWAREGQKLTLANPSKSSPAVRNLFVTYGAVQGLDVLTTAIARNRGASETNPALRGGFAQGLAIKAGLGVATVLAVKAVQKKSKRAAIITMIALNVATAAVVVNNIKVAKHSR